MEFIVDGGWGVYVPKMVAEYGWLSEGGINKEDIKILLEGPDHEWYWETWDIVLNNFKTQDGKVLFVGECGDVFLALPEECED